MGRPGRNTVRVRRGFHLDSAIAGVAILGAAIAAATIVMTRVIEGDRPLEPALVYMLLALIGSAVWGYVVGALAAVAGDLLLDYHFIEPVGTLSFDSRGDFATLSLFLGVVLIGALMLSRLRHEARLAATRQAEAQTLLVLTRELSRIEHPGDALNVLSNLAARALGARAVQVLQQRNGWQTVSAAGAGRDVPRDLAALADRASASGETVRYGSLAHGRVSIPGRATPGGGMLIPFGGAAADRGVMHVLAPVRPPGGVDVTRLLSAIADEAHMTLERVRLTEESNAGKGLREADEFKTVLLSSVSHDLRTPLTAIKAAISSVRDESIPWTHDDLRDFHETIEHETDRLTGTVDNLLQMSRLDSGTMRPTIQRIELRSFLDDIVNEHRQRLDGRTVEVHTQPGEVWALGDEVLLRQAIVNLLDNAARYSHPDGAVTASATAHGAAVHVQVADDGPGIAPADLPHLFDRFYRGRDSGEQRGSGLGLAIVKGMVELSGGWISVSNVGGGAAFRITLPRAEEPSP
jgi:two-component system sensor histidine kinase KdpD